MADALIHQAEAGATAFESGACGRAANLYRGFVRLVHRHSGKKIDATAATILIDDAEYLIAHCP